MRVALLLALAALAGASVERRFARLEQRIAFLHERVVDLLCADKYDGHTETGAWCLRKGSEQDGIALADLHFLDKHVAEVVLSVIGQRGSVLDVGAGSGQYCYFFAKKRDASATCDSVDCALNVESFTQGRVKWADLTQPLLLDRHEKYDWVLSLEVGEHLPAQYEDQFFRTLHELNTCGVLLSWAIENQPGKGHVNTHNNDYVTAKMQALGYVLDGNVTERARTGAEHWWFEKSFMAFRNTAASAAQCSE